MKNLIILLLFPLLTFSQWTQIGQDIIGENSNDELGNQGGLGVSLSSDGNTVVVGSRKGNTVRVFENINSVWTQKGNTIPGGTSADFFGGSVNVNSNGTIIAIGAPRSYANGTNSGLASVFQYTSNSWTQIGNTIIGDNAEDKLGSSVSLNSDGSILAIGIRHGSTDKSGQVKIYKIVNGVWTQIGNSLFGTANGAWFGHSISLNSAGNKIVIGSPYDASGSGQTGLVQIFENVGNSWGQLGNNVYGNNPYDIFGYSVDFNTAGDRFISGAVFNTSTGTGNDSGYALAYENVGGTWTQIGVFNGESANDRYGIEVAISGNGRTVAIGGSLNSGSGITKSGHVQVFEDLSGSWQQVNTDIDGDGYHNYTGRALDLNENGQILAIATPLGDQNGNNAGHIKVYHDDSSLSLEEFSANSEILIYPNPSYDTAKIILKENYAAIQVKVIDFLGKVIFTQEHFNTNEIILDTQVYATGVYTLYLNMNDKTTIGKLFIK